MGGSIFKPGFYVLNILIERFYEKRRLLFVQIFKPETLGEQRPYIIKDDFLFRYDFRNFEKRIRVLRSS
jgi:hypothetical protein